MTGKWSGTPLCRFLQRIGADAGANNVGVDCADAYREGIDMPTALHPWTLTAFRLAKANPGSVAAMYITDEQPRGNRTGRGYNWVNGV